MKTHEIKKNSVKDKIEGKIHSSSKKNEKIRGIFKMSKKVFKRPYGGLNVAVECLNVKVDCPKSPDFDPMAARKIAQVKKVLLLCQYNACPKWGGRC